MAIHQSEVYSLFFWFPFSLRDNINKNWNPCFSWCQTCTWSFYLHSATLQWFHLKEAQEPQLTPRCLPAAGEAGWCSLSPTWWQIHCRALTRPSAMISIIRTECNPSHYDWCRVLIDSSHMREQAAIHPLAYGNLASAPTSMQHWDKLDHHLSPSRPPEDELAPPSFPRVSDPCSQTAGFPRYRGSARRGAMASVPLLSVGPGSVLPRQSGSQVAGDSPSRRSASCAHEDQVTNK